MITDSIDTKAFAVTFQNFVYWDVASLRLSLSNKCHWPTIPLGQVCNIRFEIVPQEKHEKVNFLDRISFDEGKVFSGKRTATKMVQYRAVPGDIVVSKINARKRAIGIVPDGPDLGITIHFRSLIPDTSKVNTEFLWAALRSQYCTNQFNIETGGIGKGEISEERLLSVQVPYPPPSVQQAIVDHWHKAKGKIEAANKRVEQIKADIDARFYKDLGLKPPMQAQLPKSLSVWWKDFPRWGVDFNQQVQTGCDISKGRFPVVSLGSILDMVQYGTSDKANINGEGTPVIRMNNIVSGTLNLKDLKHIKLSERETVNLLLREGDILINRTNSKELVGKCAVFHEVGDYVFASYLIRLRANVNKADPDFIAFVLNSTVGRQQIDAMSRQIIGQANINTEEIRSLSIPLPKDVEEQRKIMRRVDEGRKEIAREQDAAKLLARNIEKEIETMILGKLPVKET